MKYDKFSNMQRIEVAYDSLHHGMNYQEIAYKHEINYNSTRSIITLIKDKKGTDYKHLQMYCDLNNPVMICLAQLA